MTSIAQWQAQRARATSITPYEQPEHEFLSNLPAGLAPVSVEHRRQHVLPRARRAITHSQLEQWQAEGLTEQEMVARVNAAHPNPRTAEFQAWKEQVLDPAVERARKRQLLRAARLAQDEAELDTALAQTLDLEGTG